MCQQLLPTCDIARVGALGGARDNAYPDAEVRERGVVYEGRCSCWLVGRPGVGSWAVQLELWDEFEGGGVLWRGCGMVMSRR